MLPAGPVKKECCSHQTVKLLPCPYLSVYPEGIQEGKKQDTGPVQFNCIKGMISMSPDSCIFHTQKCTKFINLRCLIFLN